MDQLGHDTAFVVGNAIEFDLMIFSINIRKSLRRPKIRRFPGGECLSAKLLRAENRNVIQFRFFQTQSSQSHIFRFCGIDHPGGTAGKSNLSHIKAVVLHLVKGVSVAVPLDHGGLGHACTIQVQ